MSFSLATLKKWFGLERCYANVPLADAPADSQCHLSLICQRCHKCLAHCTCPPMEMRAPGRRS